MLKIKVKTIHGKTRSKVNVNYIILEDLGNFCNAQKVAQKYTELDQLQKIERLFI